VTSERPGTPLADILDPVSRSTLARPEPEVAPTSELVPLARLARIEEILRQRGDVRVGILAQELGVSEMTVRRDLSELAERGIARRSHGGAVLVDSSFSDPYFVGRRQQQRVVKLRLAEYCASLLPDAGSLFVGGGTTTCEVVGYLRDRPGLDIFTANLAAASHAKSGGARISVLGGTVQGPTCSLVGDLARTSLALLWAETAVIGADGISALTGPTSHSAAEADVARMMVERTRGDLICVVDGTKWAAKADHVVVGAHRISRIITDAVPDRELQRLTDMNVTVDVV
jgi:DeoR family transcriptional regulator, aga operon transcriptional repressor